MLQTVRVAGVKPGSPAEKAGLLPGDFIVEVNGKRVKTTRDVLSEIGMEIGKPMEFKVKRQNSSELVAVTVVSSGGHE